MLANYHTHTTRCHHAFGTEREYIEQAIAQGFTVLGFSDHVPQPYPKGFRSGIRMTMDEIEDYTGTLVKLRDEYKDQIKILIGYEVEYSARFFPTLLKELRRFPLDYLIQGQHFAVNEIDGFYVGAPFSKAEDLKAYVDTTIEGMETGLFTYLAHPDLPYFLGNDDIYLHQMRRIVEKAVELDIPLEVNMYGFSDHRNYPCHRFFNMAKELHPKFVLGCDAHQPKLIRQPETVPGLSTFLEEYGIECGDNFVEIRDPN
ncbi:MAG: histidinol-phosphatase [Clostridiales bacterium]|nr:histidinol-phosphatase [Clostridiales bacterium]